MEPSPSPSEFIEASNAAPKNLGHNKLQLEVETLQKELLSKNTTIESYQNEINSYIQKTKSHEEECAKLSAEKIQLQEKLKEAVQKYDNSPVHSNLLEAQKKIELLSSQNSALHDQLSFTKKELSEAQLSADERAKELSQIQLSLLNLQQNFDQLSLEYGVGVEQNNTLKDQLSTCENNLQSKEKELAFLKDELAKTKGVTLELNEVIQEKNKEIELLNNSLLPTPPPSDSTNTFIRGKSVRASKSSRRL